MMNAIIYQNTKGTLRFESYNYREEHVWFKLEYLLPTIKMRMILRLYLQTIGWRLLKGMNL
ncbi:hypothetical protein A3860_17420 [Niastella vici]|uniref:Uncharacterized protein n=1 Tax=Niastella vici TaxID=1703345 RepID=A0A1V9G4H0_9BACT|nr:hypothetical protein A3860_17420 [Niastella vici]